MIQISKHKRWAVVLAAGEGARLAQLTTDANGVATPKQFCSLDGRRTLLDATLSRAAAVSDARRTLVVVAAQHENWWREHLAHVPRENIIVQPRNCGTASGVALALEFVLARDREASVALLPSDHYVEADAVLAGALRRAFRALTATPAEVVLLGVTPDAPEREYGWIVPGAPLAGEIRCIDTFVEKPDERRASELLAAGALWSSFLIVARAAVLNELIAARRPDVARALRGAAHLSPAELRERYAATPVADLSRDVFQGAESALCVIRVPQCGWTDLGTPRRVASCLRRARASAPRFDAAPAVVRGFDLGSALQARGELFAAS